MALATGKAVAVWVTLFGAYYLAPATFLVGRAGVVLIFIGASALFALTVVWQVRQSAGPGLPAVQAVRTLVLLIPFFPGPVRFLLSLDGRHLGPELL